MNWQQLRDGVYYCDGSFRDILIYNTTKNDWIAWADFVNQNYTVSFKSYESERPKDKINMDTILEYWEDVHDNCSSASVFIDNIRINAFFAADDEIENDITPLEINSIEDHIKLVKYMTEISRLLNKKVILTPENTPETELITIYNDHMVINL
jgi:hypothetical protein